MKKQLLFLVIVSCLSSCHKNWLFLNEKKYCASDDYFYLSDRIPINPKAFYDEEKIDFLCPFIFKADSFIVEKDSLYSFYSEYIKVKKCWIKTHFLFHEISGFAGVPVGISKNAIRFPVYITNEIDSIKRESILKDLFNEEKYYIKILQKGNSSLFEIETKNETIYILDRYGLIIPNNLPYGEYGNVGCGITGGGYTFIHEGLAFFIPSSHLFLPEDREYCYLKEKYIQKLYK